ncbi:outer-membrane lipoprotein LolB [Arenicella chitinivorans]|uniref:Outer-membrane lipoprotein LolB n=1 Tax=Arenicella chitinivorans TaxID=1329800 RepID=A0A918RNC9_9GAMM|nr:lipoprotein insertase outer membrane protein LolB [Arenicella chitinivorans]GHA06627.1 outer-membrane lipoprotein LolB [Arenicella chitinivorans]
MIQMNSAGRILALSGILLLSACTSLPSVPGDNSQAWSRDKQFFSTALEHHDQRLSWRYNAKVGVRTPKANENANLVWQRDDDSHRVRLYGPLGAGAVVIDFDSKGVVVSDNKGEVHRGRSAERLLNRIVGWPIPLEALTFWLFALPNPAAVYQYQLSDDGRVSALRQQGWEIRYSAYRQFENGDWLPRKVVARKPVREGEVVVRLVSKSWQ